MYPVFDELPTEIQQRLSAVAHPALQFVNDEPNKVTCNKLQLLFDVLFTLLPNDTPEYLRPHVIESLLQRTMEQLLNVATHPAVHVLTAEWRPDRMSLERWARLRELLRPRLEHYAELFKAGKRLDSSEPLPLKVAPLLGDETDFERLVAGRHRLAQEPTVVQVIKNAMERRGWTAGRLARELKPVLRRMKSKHKADRSTIYRIMTGETKYPSRDITEAIIKALKLNPQHAELLHRQFGNRAAVKKNS